MCDDRYSTRPKFEALSQLPFVLHTCIHAVMHKLLNYVSFNRPNVQYAKRANAVIGAACN